MSKPLTLRASEVRALRDVGTVEVVEDGGKWYWVGEFERAKGETP